MDARSPNLVSELAKNKPKIPTLLLTGHASIRLGLTRKTGEIDESKGKFLSVTDRNIIHVTNMFNDLLNLSCIESGRMQFNFQDVGLEEDLEGIWFVLKIIGLRYPGRSFWTNIDLYNPRLLKTKGKIPVRKA